jgi:hypothetical protein
VNFDNIESLIWRDIIAHFREKTDDVMGGFIDEAYAVNRISNALVVSDFLNEL